MVAEQIESRSATHQDLTDAGRADVQARAADIVLGLADGHGLRKHPRLRGDLVWFLATDEGRAMAARAVVRRFGFVSMHPQNFVRMQLERDSWPCGF